MKQNKKSKLKRNAKLFLNSEEGKITRGKSLAISTSLMLLGGTLDASQHKDIVPVDNTDPIDAATLVASSTTGNDVSDLSHASHCAH